MNYDQVNTQYMQEVKDYLAKVANGRRVAGYDPMARQFSPQAEDQRQAKALGVPYTLPPQATAPYSPQLSPQYGFTPEPPPVSYSGPALDWLKQLPKRLE